MGGRVSGASTCVAGSVRGRSAFPCPGATRPCRPRGASSHLLSSRRARSAGGVVAHLLGRSSSSSGAWPGAERTSDAAGGRAGRLIGWHSPALRLVPQRPSLRWEARGEGPVPCALNAFISPGRRWGRAGRAPWMAVALGVGQGMPRVRRQGRPAQLCVRPPGPGDREALPSTGWLGRHHHSDPLSAGRGPAGSGALGL